MSVKRGREEEYARRHSPIWEDLRTVLKDHGVSNYSIFLDPTTNNLFAYAEIESEELWSKIAETDECKRWWEYMKDLMPVNEDYSPLSVDLDEVFHLE